MLFKAAEKGHLEAVRMLIEAGANQITNSRDLEEDLRDAAKDGELERLQSLLEAGVNIDESDGDGRTALYKAAKEGRIEAVQLLLEAGAGQIERSRRVWKDLREAAERGEVEKLQALIEAGVNANSFDSRGRRALMLAAEKGRLDAVRLLIDHGSDEVPPRVSLRRLLETDFQNESALDKARRKERTDVIAVLEAEEARLLALEQEREREAERVRSNFERARSNRLSRYEVGVTTRAEFRSERDFVSSREQGIVLVTGDGRTIIYSLGRSTLADSSDLVGARGWNRRR